MKKVDPSSKSLHLDFSNVVENRAATNTATAFANGIMLETYTENLMIPSPSTTTYKEMFTVELLQGITSLGI